MLIVVSCWVHQEFRARLCHDNVLYLGCMLVVQLSHHVVEFHVVHWLHHAGYKLVLVVSVVRGHQYVAIGVNSMCFTVVVIQ